MSIPRGIPADLLDWSVMVRTKTYDPDFDDSCTGGDE